MKNTEALEISEEILTSQLIDEIAFKMGDLTEQQIQELAENAVQNLIKRRDKDEPLKQISFERAKKHIEKYGHWGHKRKRLYEDLLNGINRRIEEINVNGANKNEAYQMMQEWIAHFLTPFMDDLGAEDVELLQDLSWELEDVGKNLESGFLGHQDKLGEIANNTETVIMMLREEEQKKEFKQIIEEKIEESIGNTKPKEESHGALSDLLNAVEIIKQDIDYLSKENQENKNTAKEYFTELSHQVDNLDRNISSIKDLTDKSDNIFTDLQQRAVEEIKTIKTKCLEDIEDVKKSVVQLLLLENGKQFLFYGSAAVSIVNFGLLLFFLLRG